MKRSLFALAPLLTACAGDPPVKLGMENDQLLPCPDSPNCVSSYDSDETHQIEPLASDLASIQAVIRTLEEAEVIQQSERYLRCEFTTPILGFVDDVEFLYDPGSKVTHVRSASRIGYSDLGTNRKRVERIRALLESQ